MNFFNAPLLYLVGRVPKEQYYRRPPAGHMELQRRAPILEPKGCVIWIDCFLATVIVLVGLGLAIIGRGDNIEISGMDLTIKTQTAGIGLTALGVILYAIMSRIIMKDSD